MLQIKKTQAHEGPAVAVTFSVISAYTLEDATIIKYTFTLEHSRFRKGLKPHQYYILSLRQLLLMLQT